MSGVGAAARAGVVRRVGVACLLALATLVASAPARPSPAAAADVTFGTPHGSAVLLQPLQFFDTFQAPERPSVVELLTQVPGQEGTVVQQADVTQVAGGYEASATIAGQEPPNARFGYRFRVTLPDGTVALGPQASITVVDNRFTWHTVTGSVVRLHWYAGNQAFGQRALAIGEAAIRKASATFGVAKVPPVDFFVYGDTQPFLQALGPGTRENTGGEYIPAIQTMFADIAPDQIGSGWVSSVVPHELTHLVFDLATRNPYHDPPLWLDEGLAVYLSDGPGPHRAELQQGIAQGRIVPLDGLTGAFPRSNEGDVLAYAEAVSAVDYFMRTYGQAALLTLLRAYQRGATDDEAFGAATGGTVGAFGARWLASVGVTPPPTYGPRPAPPGPVPASWSTPSPLSAGSGADRAERGGTGTLAGAPSSPGAPGNAAPPLLAALVPLAAGALLLRRRSGRGRLGP